MTKNKFIPMLFSTPMVQAILKGTKTETRRIVKYSKKIKDAQIGFSVFTDPGEFEVRGIHENGQFGISFFKEPVNKGDIIWVRETFQESLNRNEFCYKADTDNPIYLDKSWKWKPSLFMPKEACRIFLKCNSVHVERLQDIDEQSAINEGIENLSVDEFKCNLFKNYLRGDKEINYQDFTTDNAIYSYQTLWQKINGKESWDKNHFVWVYKFERIDRPNDFC